MTRDELMKQSAEALIRWTKDKTLPVEGRSYHSEKWCLIDPIWSMNTHYYRIAEPPKRVPLGPEDFPPSGTHRVRYSAWPGEMYTSVESVARDSVVLSMGGPHTYEDLMKCQRWINGKWQPCWKEVAE